MLIVSHKTQDHTHHTSAKLALPHSLSSNTLYTRPPPFPHSRIAANFGFYVGGAPFDATTQFSVLSKPASMAPTPQLIWRIPQNMELMDRRRAVWIPLGRHPHRYLGRGIIGFDPRKWNCLGSSLTTPIRRTRAELTSTAPILLRPLVLIVACLLAGTRKEIWGPDLFRL